MSDVKTSEGIVIHVAPSIVTHSLYLAKQFAAQPPPTLVEIELTEVVFRKAIEYLEIKHTCDVFETVDTLVCVPLSTWESHFIDNNLELVFELLSAADYLGIESLANTMTRYIATQLINKTTDQIRRQFHIVNDFSHDEDAVIQHDNQWIQRYQERLTKPDENN